MRDALGLEEGDQVIFRVEGRCAVLARSASKQREPPRS
jgi:bifunctional DNA-binding transcriptional regulator/antitoxin component of YhaV-PrlF toxin-antitoxin module